MPWDGTAFGYWSCIEMDVGVMCSCMPALYSLFKHFFPQVWSGTMRSKPSSKGGILSSGISGTIVKSADRQSMRRTGDTKDFLPLVDIEPVHDNRPGLAF